MNLAKFSVKHPVIIGMILIVLAVFGFMSLTSTNIEFFTNISTPEVYVVSIYPGASAEDVERDVTNVLETNFVTLPKFKSVKSTSGSSYSLVTITYQDGVDPNEQLAEVRHRITQMESLLPQGLLGTPNAYVAGSSALPILTFSFRAGKDLGRITDYFEDTLKPQLTSIDGVSGVELMGGRKLQVHVKLHIQDLTAKGISVTNIYQILNYGNVNLPVGTGEYESKTIDIHYSGGFKSLEDIKNLPVGSGDGTVLIRLKDVADVYLDYPDESTKVFRGDEDIAVVSITRRSDGDVLKIAKQVKKVLAETSRQTGGAVQYDIISDDSRTIKASLSTVITSGVTGVIMAVIILFLFLDDLRSTLIIGISIPLSILFTFIGVKITGITINLMSLSGMVVALGMIVDGSIVMIEQVYRHYSAKNPDGTPKLNVENSILTGSKEVTSSIFASTLTTVVVFVPIAMIQSFIGDVLRDIALTIVFSLIASVAVALIVVPFLMKIFLKEGGPKPKKKRKHEKTLFNRFVDKVEVAYKRMLRWTLKHGMLIITCAIILLVLSGLMITALGVTFIPSTDNSDFYVYMKFPTGQSVEETERRMRQTQDLINMSIPEVKTSVYYAGASGNVTSPNAPNTGYAHVVLVPVKERKRDIHDIILLTQDLLSSKIPDAQVKVSNGGFDMLVGMISDGGGYGLTLVSEDMNLLLEEAARIEDFLKKDEQVISTNVDTSYDSTTLAIEMSQEYMSSLGITSYEAGITTAILFSGIDSGRFNSPDGDSYIVHISSDISDAPITKDVISNINIKSMTGKNVSFASLADTNVEKGISQINHTNRAKTCTITANLVGEDTSGVSKRVKAYLEEEPLKDGVRSQAGGMMELIGDALPAMMRALLIAIFLIYTVMVIQFQKFRQPLLVLSTIPFCLIGVVLGLLLFGSSMSLISLMGVIALAGVVVNNGIILIDFTNLIRQEKKEQGIEETNDSLKETIIESCSSRIRPIFMTTLTTMLGVIPMAMSHGEGAEIYAPLGQAIAGGLLTSTLITLFIIPVLYFLTERKKEKKTTAEWAKEQRLMYQEDAENIRRNWRDIIRDTKIERKHKRIVKKIDKRNAKKEAAKEKAEKKAQKEAIKLAAKEEKSMTPSEEKNEN
ncbi:MAG: efflux RND transporter permease subunit [Treponemataceae bacterium]|nr:efflux RND transporter permease subunit [Treponemataceae bacterium]